MSATRVLIIMPVYNEVRHLPLVLESIRAQTFSHTRVYMVAVDGGSLDGSRDILRAWFTQGDVPGLVAVNPQRKITAALNIGLAYAGEDDIVLRLDAHTIYEPTYVADAVLAIERASADVGCIGCAHIPVSATGFGKRLVEALYTNPMGLGGADYRTGSDVREVDTAYLGAWRAALLRRVGGFNEALEAGEDAEMAARIRALGYRILRVPLPCRFIINRGPIATIRQWHRYGYWRARMLLANPRSMRLRHVVSVASAIAALALSLSPFRPALVPVFGVYCALVVRGRTRNETPAVTIASMFYFPALQLAFSAGLMRGLLSARRQRAIGSHRG